MKKIFSLGIASAVLAMTALSASAGVVVKPPVEAVTPGATITVTFVADADSDAVSFRTNATGLTLVDTVAVANAGNPLVMVSDDKLGFASLAGIKNGDVLISQTYTVTAKEGEKVSVNVTDLEGTTGVATNLSVDVKAAGADTPSGSDSGSSDVTPSGSDSGSGSSDVTPSGSDSGSKPQDGDKPADTGIALAVFPAIIAGAAVVVAKKRK